MMLEFMTCQTGPCDAILFFDDWHLAGRTSMATAAQSMRNMCELRLACKSTRRLGRRVAWASDSREVGWLSLPVLRTELTVKVRGDDA